MSRKYVLTAYRSHLLVLSGWLITMHPRCSVMCLLSRALKRLQMVNGYKDWLREHHKEYDASYQQTVMEEEAHVEQEYQERQRVMIQKLREKTKSNQLPGIITINPDGDIILVHSCRINKTNDAIVGIYGSSISTVVIEAKLSQQLIVPSNIPSCDVESAFNSIRDQTSKLLDLIPSTRNPKSLSQSSFCWFCELVFLPGPCTRSLLLHIQQRVFVAGQ
jgi:hypothetical protein